MATQRVTVIGASGTAGRAYTRALKTAGHHVLGTVRPGTGATTSLGPGITPLEIDLSDVHRAAAAIEGSDAVVVALLGRGEDPASDELASTRAAVHATDLAGVGRVVYTSVHLADARTGVAHFDIKGQLESELRDLGSTHTILRPTTFMDALDAPWLRDSALSHGVLVSPFDIDAPISYLLADDLAQLAVKALTDPRLENVTVPVGGPQAVTYRQLLPQLEEVAGRAMRYEQMDLAVLGAQQPHLADMVRLFNDQGFTLDPSPLIDALGISLTDVATFLRRSQWATTASDTEHDDENGSDE